jgi:hypothetical protein
VLTDRLQRRSTSIGLLIASTTPVDAVFSTHLPAEDFA